MKKFLSILLALSAIPSFAQKNLIQNGGFESELMFWRGDVAKTSPFDKKTGKNSCVITQYVGAEWKAVDQIISIPKNTVAVEFSAWIKSDAIEQGTNSWNTGKFDVEFLNAGEKNISNESIASVVGTTTWTFYKKILPVSASASKFRVMLALSQTNGTILFDDVKAVAITQDELNKIQEEENAKRNPVVISGDYEAKPLVLTNGDFENGTTSWRGNADISNTVFNEGKAALHVTSTTADWTAVDQIADIPADATAITISGWLKSDNIIQGKEIWNNGLLNVEFTSDGKNKTSDDQSIAFVTGTTDWKFYTKTFQLPKDTKKYRIMVGLGFATGTLYADAISVEFK